jgi:hypothetical protein
MPLSFGPYHCSMVRKLEKQNGQAFPMSFGSIVALNLSPEAGTLVSG